jgi:hypothetical protein
LLRNPYSAGSKRAGGAALPRACLFLRCFGLLLAGGHFLDRAIEQAPAQFQRQ